MAQSPRPSRLTEGVFTCSKKRPYAEYVFDVYQDENGKSCKRTPGRRGPLNESTRQSMETVKASGGACWRCKMLKKPCDGKSPCKQCASTDSKVWNMGCRRGGLEVKFQWPKKYLELSSDTFFIKLPFGWQRLKFDVPPLKFTDLDLRKIRQGDRAQSRDVLLDFLKQFHNMGLPVRDNWGIRFNRPVAKLITTCAKIQEDKLYYHLPASADFPEESLIVAFSLQLLAHTLNISYIFSGYESFSSFEPSCHTAETSVLFRGKPIQTLFPRDIPDELSELLKCNYNDPFSSMIREVVRIAQRMLLRRRSNDIPSLFCVLCLLRLVLLEVLYLVGISELNFRLCKVWGNLCHLYSISAKGCHPFTVRMEAESYAAFMEDDKLAVAHFLSLNDVWIQEVFFQMSSIPKSELEDEIELFFMCDEHFQSA